MRCRRLPKLTADLRESLRNILIAWIIGIEPFQNQGDPMRHVMNMGNPRDTQPFSDVAPIIADGVRDVSKGGLQPFQ